MSFDFSVNGLPINHLPVVEQRPSVCMEVSLGEENYSFCCNEAFWRAYLYGTAKKQRACLIVVRHQLKSDGFPPER